MAHLSRNHIQNIDNYRNSFEDSTIEIVNRYMLIIKEYLEHAENNIYIQNDQYYNYVLKKGINTLNHIFKIMLIYTKNLDIVYYNCQKSYMYYIEFIGQIGDENHSFLELNSKDAALFVYKKTIFEINNDIRINHSLDNTNIKIINDIDHLIKIYNILLNIIINKNNNKLNTIIKIVNSDLINIMNKIYKFYTDLEATNNSVSNKNTKFECITIFSLYSNKNNIIEILEIFIKKLKKINNPNPNKLEKLLINQDLIINFTPIKYVNFLINNI